MYIQCSYDDGGYGPNTGGDDGNGGVDNRPGCAECKSKAQREHDTRLNNAKLTLSGAVLAGCHAAGAGTFIAFNGAGWWAHLIPGIGTAAIEALSVLGGLTVDIACLVQRVSAFTAEKATIENSYYKDQRNCEQLFTDCN